MAELLAFINGKTPAEATIALANNPYNCKMIKHPDPSDHRYVIRYNLASKTPTDFSHVISRQCRGPVLLHDPSTNQWQMLAYAFDKFFNEGDHNNQHLPIDTTSLRFQEKIDGSLIKLYWYDVHRKWVFATNNTICATLATLEPHLGVTSSKYNTFMDLIDEIKHVVPLESLDKTKTYIFELVSPYNIIVVEHTNIELFHLGTRCNITFAEQEIDIGVKKPKLYDVNSIDDFRKLIAKFDGKKFEGGVIVDSKFIRRKIKNADYLQFHYTKSLNDTIPLEELAVISLLKYEKDEFVATYPDHADFINELNDLLERYISEIEKVQQELDEINCKNRAEYAKIAKTSPCPSIHFSLLSKKLKIGDKTTTNIREFVFYLPDDFDMRKQKARHLLQTIENYRINITKETCLSCKESKRMNLFDLPIDYECRHCGKGICQKCSDKLIKGYHRIWKNDPPTDWRTDKLYMDIKRNLGLDPNFNLYERETIEKDDRTPNGYFFCSDCVVNIDSGKEILRYGRLIPASNNDCEI